MPAGSGRRAGGIAGQNVGTISNCVNEGAVTNAAGDTGGIAGVNGTNTPNSPSYPGTLSNCVNRGNVTVTQAGGGIVGVNSSVGTMSNCVNDGDVYGSGLAENVGGIAGKNNGGTITNCVNYNNVSDSKYSGGIGGQTTDVYKGQTVGLGGRGGVPPALAEKGRHRLAVGRDRHPLGRRDDQPHTRKIIKNTGFDRKIHGVILLSNNTLLNHFFGQNNNIFCPPTASLQHSPPIFSLPCATGSQ